MKRMAALLAIAILVIPPLPAQDKALTVSVCGQPGVRVSIPVKQPHPGEGDDHSCCKKGCHAANDRRKKLNDSDPDDCC